MKSCFALGTWGTRGRVLRTVAIVFLFPALFFSMFAGSIAQGVVFGVLFGVFFQLAFPALIARMQVKAELARGNTHEIIVSMEGVQRTVSGTIVRHPWSAITKVLELPNAFLLFSGASPVGSIEKSAVPDATALAAVRDLVSSVRPIYARSSAFLALERRASEA
jgi:hypothetical protein